MKPPARQRSTRDRRAKTPLSEEAVIDAALAILKSDGLEAVTMRRVAAALDTGAASLYVYTDGRESLLRSMFDRVTATIELETPDTRRWREQLHAVLERMQRALAAHPGISALGLAGTHAPGAVQDLNLNVLAILKAAGLAPQEAAWASEVLMALVFAGIGSSRLRFAADAIVDGVLVRETRQ